MDVPAYLRVLSLAEARTAEGDWPGAAASWEQVTTANPVNGSHWDHLAQARFELGGYAGALAAWQRAGELGVWDRRTERPTAFRGELQYRRACCHARLGDGDAALGELAAAVRAGLREPGRARDDENWKSLRDDPRFRALLDLDEPGAGTLDRTPGWRRDLAVLDREIRRRAVAPFRFVAEEDFAARIAGLSEQVPARSDAQMVTGILGVLATLGDGHAGIAGPDDFPALRATVPVEYWQFPEGVFVTAADPKYRDLLGAQVIAVDGRPVAEVIAGLRPVICQDNDYQGLTVAALWLRNLAVLHALGLAAVPDAVTLTVRPLDSAARQVTLAAEPSSPPRLSRGLPPAWIRLADTRPAPPPACERNRYLSYWFEFDRAAGLVYAQLNSVLSHPAESLPAFTGRLLDFVEDHDVDALVLDLRWNGGGNTFLTQPLLHRLIGCRKVNWPGGLFVITGRRTFSAAQNTATLIERNTHAVFAGEPTGSSPNFTGEMVPFELPWSRLQVNVSDLYWQSSWPMDTRPFIAPEIYAPVTFADYLANRDPVMAAIAAYREHLPGR